MSGHDMITITSGIYVHANNRHPPSEWCKDDWSLMFKTIIIYFCDFHTNIGCLLKTINLN